MTVSLLENLIAQFYPLTDINKNAAYHMHFNRTILWSFQKGTVTAFSW